MYKNANNFLLSALVIISVNFPSHAQSSELPIETVIQRGHEAPILSANYSKDGLFIATVSKDQTTILWEASSGRQLRTFVGHVKSVTDVDFHPDGASLITCSYDGTVILWDIYTGERIKTYTFEHWLNAVRFSPDGKSFLTAGKGREAFLIDTNSGDIKQRYAVYPGQYGINVRFSPDGKNVLTGNDDGKAFVYDIKSSMAKDTLRNIESSYCGGCWAHIDWSDEKTISYASNNGPLTLYDAESGDLLQSIGTVLDDPHSVGKSEEHVFVANEEHIQVYSIKGDPTAKFDQQEENINKVIMSPDGNHLVSAGDDQIARIWNVKNGHLVKTLSGYLNRPNERGLNFSKTSYWHSGINKYISIRNQTIVSSNGRLMIKPQMDSVAYLIDIESGRVVQSFGHQKAVITAIFTPDNNFVIAVAENDMSVNHIHDIDELPPHFIRELSSFFEDYKKLENKSVQVEDFQNKARAHEVVLKSIEDYNKKFS